VESPSQSPKRERSRRLLIVSVGFYTGVVLAILWFLVSVVTHLVRARDPLRVKDQISAKADRPQEIYQCFFDTMLLFDVMLEDYGRIASNTRCLNGSIKQDWGRIYAWDTHPWSVVHRGDAFSEQTVGVWRYRRHEIWSRCRLYDEKVLGRSKVLTLLASVHEDLDELRRALTAQMRRFDDDATPVVDRIRSRLADADSQLKQPRRLEQERRLIKWRLRKWGIHRNPPPICPI
jgi:hypothetical protein